MGAARAEHVHEAGASAFLYWWGGSSSTANSGLIRLVGDSYETSKRFCAIAAFSRFVRPGAIRVDAGADSSSLGVSAFRNRDGSLATQVINRATTPTRVRLPFHGRVTAYTTDATHDLAPAPVRGRWATLPPRSLVTYVVRSHDHQQ